MFSRKIFLAILVALCLVTLSSAAQCIDVNGMPVDWWVVYKLPTLDKVAPTGMNFSYADTNNPLTLSVLSLDEEAGAISKTMRQIYKGNMDNVGYVMYNDENPMNDKITSTYGHTKVCTNKLSYCVCVRVVLFSSGKTCQFILYCPCI